MQTEHHTRTYMHIHTTQLIANRTAIVDSDTALCRNLNDLSKDYCYRRVNSNIDLCPAMTQAQMTSRKKSKTRDVSRD